MYCVTSSTRRSPNSTTVYTRDLIHKECTLGCGRRGREGQPVQHPRGLQGDHQTVQETKNYLLDNTFENLLTIAQHKLTNL